MNVTQSAIDVLPSGESETVLRTWWTSLSVDAARRRHQGCWPSVLRQLHRHHMASALLYSRQCKTYVRSHATLGISSGLRHIRPFLSGPSIFAAEKVVGPRMRSTGLRSALATTYELPAALDRRRWIAQQRRSLCRRGSAAQSASFPCVLLQEVPFRCSRKNANCSTQSPSSSEAGNWTELRLWFSCHHCSNSVSRFFCSPIQS